MLLQKCEICSEGVQKVVQLTSEGNNAHMNDSKACCS
jgi:hypothetical protein